MAIDWDLLEDQTAVEEGKELPLISWDERQRRALSLIAGILKLAASLGITKAALAKELGISRPHFYRWQRGKSLPTMKNYRKLVQLCIRLQALVGEWLRFEL